MISSWIHPLCLLYNISTLPFQSSDCSLTEYWAPVDISHIPVSCTGLYTGRGRFWIHGHHINLADACRFSSSTYIYGYWSPYMHRTVVSSHNSLGTSQDRHTTKTWPISTKIFKSHNNIVQCVTAAPEVNNCIHLLFSLTQCAAWLGKMLQ